MIEKAQSVVATSQENEAGRLEAVVPEGETASDKPVDVGSAAGSETRVNIAPGIVATTSGVKSTLDAAPEFRSWVANAKISGVFQGATPRALVNGRTVRTGQMVDEALGIMFEGINAETKEIIFKDRSGATVLRRY